MSSDRTKDPEEGEGMQEGMDSEEEDEEELSEEDEEETDDPSLKEKIAWVDIETTGFDVDQETIMEVAVVVTNSLLNVLAESPNLVLQVEDKLLTDMKQPYKDQHNKWIGATEAGWEQHIIAYSRLNHIGHLGAEIIVHLLIH